MDRRIKGFHEDDEHHWVAELECGHDQHVRHTPPWLNRPWVVTSAGRTSALGKMLNCKKCDTSSPLPRFGAGVVLRRLAVTDLAAFQAYRSDAELGKYQGWSPINDADAEAFLEEMSAIPLFRPGEWAQIGIGEPQGVGLLGDIGLYLAADLRHAEIGFTLARHAHGRGLATAAVREAIQLVFDFTEVERVLGITDVRNHASLRVLERVGMIAQEERTVVFRGESCVECVYAMQRNTVKPCHRGPESHV